MDAHRRNTIAALVVLALALTAITMALVPAYAHTGGWSRVRQDALFFLVAGTVIFLLQRRAKRRS